MIWRMRCLIVTGARLLAIVVAVLALSGWKVLTIEEDRLARERGGNQFNVANYVERIWQPEVVDYANDASHPITTILSEVRKNFSVAAPEFGRQAGKGSPWTFWGTGEGRVISVDTTSRVGRATIRLDSSGTPVDVVALIGPVIFGTAIRDALPSIKFNDFDNQIVFAEVANALTARAFKNTKSTLTQIDEGDEIKFLGAFSLQSAQDDIELTILQIDFRE